VSTVTGEAATDAERYLTDVARHLGGLGAEEQAELLEDLNQHLLEIAAEPGPSLYERLGSPEVYAAELLASAGVTPEGRGKPMVARLRTRAASLRSRVVRSAPGREAARMAPVVRPAWWVARGYLSISLLAALDGSGSFPGFPIPELFGSRLMALLGIVVAIPLSVRLGQRELGRGARAAVVAGNAVLVVFGLVLLSRAGDPDVRYVDAGQFGGPAYRPDGCLSDARGRPITNLYAYDAEGRLLDPVLLYDALGQPIDNLCPDYDSRGRSLVTEYRRDANGAPVINAFPRKQSVRESTEPPYTVPGEPGSFGRTEPVRPPAVVIPKLAPSTSVPTTSTTVATTPPG
jgi:hypothetical protein